MTGDLDYGLVVLGLAALAWSCLGLWIVEGTMKRNSWSIGAALLVAGLVFTSVACHRGGYIFGEADWFLVDHNDGRRTALETILCPHAQDASLYLAREVAHCAERVDAKFIHACVSFGHAHLLSIVTYACFVGISWIFWRWARAVGMDPVLAMLLLAMFWTAPPIFMGGVFVRTGHAVATFWCSVLLFALWCLSSASVPLSAPVREVARGAVFLAALLGVWADRQGLFAVAGIGLVLAFLPGARNKWVTLPAMGAAILAHTVYNIWVGPRLIEQMTWFHANLGFQAGPASHPLNRALDTFPGGALVAMDNLRLLCGSMSVGGAACLVIWMAAQAGRRWWIILGSVALVASMNGFVMSVQTALNWPDVQSVYYHILPTTVLFGLVAYTFLGRPVIEARWIVLAMIVGNAIALPGHYKTRNAGHMAGYIAGTPMLLKAWSEVGKLPDDPRGVEKFDLKTLALSDGMDRIMKNPLVYGGRLTAEEFVGSSQYYQWLRSRKGLPFKQPNE